MDIPVKSHELQDLDGVPIRRNKEIIIPIMRIQIGVMGSASGKINEEAKKKAYQLGIEIGKSDCALITGGCPGLPYEATKGAKEAGGLTIGISPGLNQQQHVEEYNSPIDDIDVMIYTGNGLMGREVTAIRSCDIVIIVGGRSGTLGEFSVAYDEGKIIGVLENTGGITTILKELEQSIKKPTGSEVIYEGDPAQLIRKLLESYQGKVNSPTPWVETV